MNTFIVATLSGMLLLIGSAEAEPMVSMQLPVKPPAIMHYLPSTPAPADCSSVVLNGMTYTICPANPFKPPGERVRPIPVPKDACLCVFCDCTGGYTGPGRNF